MRTSSRRKSALSIASTVSGGSSIVGGRSRAPSLHSIDEDWDADENEQRQAYSNVSPMSGDDDEYTATSSYHNDHHYPEKMTTSTKNKNKNNNKNNKNKSSHAKQQNTVEHEHDDDDDDDDDDDGAPLKLKVVTNPTDIFYKDEGGKSNHLTACVRVENRANPNETSLGGKMFIVPTLCYENGRDVEDGPDIFRILSYEPNVVTSSDEIVTLKFRIEKVSRRKDGQRFKVRFDVTSASTFQAKPVSTTCVNVLSKRKFPSMHGGNRSTASHKKSTSGSKRSKASSPGGMSSYNNNNNNGRRSNSFDDCHQDAQNHHPQPLSPSHLELIERMSKTIEMLESKVNTLNNRVAYLESEQSMMAESLKRSREDFETSSVDSPNPAIEPASADSLSSNKFHLDCEDAEYLVGMAGLEPKAKRPMTASRTSADMTFNFGLPSSPVMTASYEY